jgi:hypothetical protein
MLDLRANCSGLLLITRTVTLELVGFSISASIMVETPKGDLMLFIMTGGLGVHLKLNS